MSQFPNNPAMPHNQIILGAQNSRFAFPFGNSSLLNAKPAAPNPAANIKPPQMGAATTGGVQQKAQQLGKQAIAKEKLAQQPQSCDPQTLGIAKAALYTRSTLRRAAKRNMGKSTLDADASQRGYFGNASSMGHNPVDAGATALLHDEKKGSLLNAYADKHLRTKAADQTHHSNTAGATNQMHYSNTTGATHYSEGVNGALEKEAKSTYEVARGIHSLLVAAGMAEHEWSKAGNMAPPPGPASLPPAPGGPTSMAPPPAPMPGDPNAQMPPDAAAGAPPAGAPPALPPGSPSGLPQPGALPPDQPGAPPTDPTLGMPGAPGTVPSNPRINPPRPRDSHDAIQEALMLRMFEDQRTSADTADPHDSLKNELMAVGGKMAGALDQPLPNVPWWGPDLVEAVGGAGMGGMMGAPLGTAAGAARGNVAEGLGRGIFRGGATGLGSGLGGALARHIGDSQPLSGSARGALTLGGNLLGGLAGYALGGKMLGKPVGKGKEEEKEKQGSSFSRYASKNHFLKASAQDNSKPQRSATGESQGLTFAHKPDHYAQGQEAWASLSQYFKGGDKKRPNPFIGKHAACGCGCAECKKKQMLASQQSSDDGNGLVTKTSAAGLQSVDHEQVYLNKEAAGAMDFFRGMAPAARGLWNSAAKPALKQYGGRALTGAAVGGFGGGDAMGMPTNYNIGGFNPLGAVVGAGSFIAGGRGGRQTGAVANLARPLTHGMTGGMVGNALDYAGKETGIAPNTNFARWGANLGTGVGMARGAAGYFGNKLRMDRLAGNQLPLPAGATPQAAGGMEKFLTRADLNMNKMMRVPQQAANEFWTGQMNPLTYPLRRAGQGLHSVARPGALKNTLEYMGMNKPQTLFGAGKNLSNAKLLGRAAGVGVGGLGLLGTVGPGLVNMGTNAMVDKMQPHIAQMYNTLAQQGMQDMDSYLASKGLLNDQGQVDPSQTVMNTVGGMADKVLQSIGLDPSQMSAAQKMMALGGAGGLGVGAAAGSPVLAGLGGAAMIPGVLSGMQGGYGQQFAGQMPGANASAYASPEYRNEWLSQLMRQGLPG